MEKHAEKKKWKLLVVLIWVLFLVAAGVGFNLLQRANVYEQVKTELANQAETISRQFADLVDTDFYANAALNDRRISEIKTISSVLEKYNDIDQAREFLENIVNTTEVKNLWVYDRYGNVLFSSGGAPQNTLDADEISSLLDSKAYELIEGTYDGDDRYWTATYFLEDDNIGLLWGVQDRWLVYAEDTFSESLKNVVQFFDWEQVIQDISIYGDGAVLAVSAIDGSVLSCPDSSFKGQPVEDLDIRIAGSKEAATVDQLLEEFPYSGEVTEIEVDSVRFYATRMDIDNDLFLVMFPVEAIEEEVGFETVLLMVPLILITGIGLLYLFCLAATDPKQSKSGSDKNRGRAIPIGKLKVFAFLAVILTLGISLYLETHLMYSQMFQYTSTTAEEVMQKKTDSEKMLQEMQTLLQQGTLEKCKIARCGIQHAAGEVDRQYVADLADCLSVSSLYVFDNQGKVLLTNAPYDGYVIDENSPFHALLEGTESVVLQQEKEETSGQEQQKQENTSDQAQTDQGKTSDKAQSDQEKTSDQVQEDQEKTSDQVQQDLEAASVPVEQAAGVTMIDDNNWVAGAVVATGSTPSMLSDNLSYETVFQRVFLKDNTVVMAINSGNMMVKYFAQVDGSLLVSEEIPYEKAEIAAADLGMDESLIKDRFNGELFAIDNQYFASVRRDDNTFLMVLRPIEFLDANNLLSVLLLTGSALIFFILLIFAAGKFNKISEEDPDAVDDQTAENKQADHSTPNRNGEKSEDDVVSLLAKLANNEKYGFEERWPSDGKKWRDKTPMEKFSTSVKLICIIAFVLIVAYVFIAREDSIFYYCFNGDWSSGVNLYSVSSCIIDIILLFLLREIIHKMLYLIARAAHSKGETICHLLNSFTGYVLFIAGVFIVLATLGVDLTTISLTAGVAGVIFGIGCQNIVADMLAGIIMAFEGVACVGDFVSFNNQFGTIQSIGVRTTKLKWFSEVTVVRNNEFKNYINMPGEETDRVVVDICVDYKESITRVESVIEKELPQIREFLCEKTGDQIKLKYRGVKDLEENGIRLSFAVYCQGMYYGWVRRMLNRELLLMCEKNDIQLAMPQIVINERTDGDK